MVDQRNTSSLIFEQPVGQQQTSQQDTAFLQTAYSSGLKEILAGKIAIANSEDPAVKQFGRWMASNHHALGVTLKKYADELGVTLQETLPQDAQTEINQLVQLRGDQFDQAYTTDQATDHQAAITLFEQQVSSGQNEALVALAEQALPLLRAHLEQATAISEEGAGGGTDPGTTPPTDDGSGDNDGSDDGTGAGTGGSGTGTPGTGSGGTGTGDDTGGTAGTGTAGGGTVTGAGSGGGTTGSGTGTDTTGSGTGTGGTTGTTGTTGSTASGSGTGAVLAAQTLPPSTGSDDDDTNNGTGTDNGDNGVANDGSGGGSGDDTDGGSDDGSNGGSSSDDTDNGSTGGSDDNETGGDDTPFSQQDLDFIRQAALAGLEEIADAENALEISDDLEIDGYARWMVSDHTAVSETLRQIAAQEEVELPTELDEARQAEVDDQASLENADFYKAYVTDQIGDHLQTMMLFVKQAETGSDPLLRAFAENALPILSEHLAEAVSLAATQDGFSFGGEFNSLEDLIIAINGSSSGGDDSNGSGSDDGSGGSSGAGSSGSGGSGGVNGDLVGTVPGSSSGATGDDSSTSGTSGGMMPQEMTSSMVRLWDAS